MTSAAGNKFVLPVFNSKSICVCGGGSWYFLASGEKLGLMKKLNFNNMCGWFARHVNKSRGSDWKFVLDITKLFHFRKRNVSFLEKNIYTFFMEQIYFYSISWINQLYFQRSAPMCWQTNYADEKDDVNSCNVITYGFVQTCNA